MKRENFPLRCRICFCGLFPILALLLILTVRSSGELAAATEVSGVYRFLVPAQEATPGVGRTNEFRVQLDGCQWKVFLRDPDNVGNPNVLVTDKEFGCDGTNIFRVDLLNPVAVKAAWGDKYSSVAASLASGKAAVYPGTYPNSREQELQHLWFAFLSGCTFRDPSGPARSLFSVELDEFETPALFPQYSLKQDHDGRPEELRLTSPGTYGVRDPQGRLQVKKHKAPFSSGYTSGLGRWVYGKKGSSPSEFRFQCFIPDTLNPNSSSNLLTAFEFTCTVTNVAAIPAILPLPELTAGIYEMEDRRFGDQGIAALEYRTTNQWLQKDDRSLLFRVRHSAKKSLEQEAALRETGNPLPEATRRRPFQWAIALISVAALGLFALRKRRS